MSESKQNYRFNPVKIAANQELDFEDIDPEIEYTNMSKDLTEFAIRVSKEAIKENSDNKFNNYIKIAKRIKLSLDNEKKGIWNVIVGSDYGSYISYDKAFLIFFRLKEIHFLIFRFGIDESTLRKDDKA